MGLNTEPWETPDITGTESEITPSMTTFCVRPDSQVVIHWRISFRIPKYPAYTLVFDVAPCRIGKVYNNEIRLLVTSIMGTI